MKRFSWIIGMVGLLLLIASGPAPAVDSFFDVFTELTAGPPYPTPPVQVMVSHREGATMVETEIVGLSLHSAMPVDLPLRMQAYDSGGGGGAGTQSFFDIFTELPPDAYPADSFFDLFVEIQPPGPGFTRIVSPPTGTSGDSFFDVFVEVDIPELGGYESLHLHGEIGPGQPLTFGSVEIPGAYTGSFFDVFVTLDKSSPIIFGSPLVSMTMTGRFIPEPATLGMLLLGGLALFRRKLNSRKTIVS